MTGTGPNPKGGADAAVLAGTLKTPLIELRFEYGDTHATNGDRLVDWVKLLPDRRWDPDNPHGKCWVVYGFGSEPSVDLGLAGFGDYVIDLDGSDGTIPDDISIDDLVTPIVELSDRDGFVKVWPRFYGTFLTKRLLGSVGRWDEDGRYFEVPASVFPVAGLDAPPEVLAASKQDAEHRAQVNAHASTVGSATSLEAAGEHGNALYEMVGGIPDWFGLELDPYQEAGAIAVAAGHSLLADEMGLGKALAHGTPVLTPNGWVPIEGIVVGDMVIGSDGEPWPVEGVYRQGVRPLRRVTFNDGTSTVVDDDHLWSVQHVRNGQRNPEAWAVKTTAEIAATIRDGSGNATWRIPVVAPVNHPEADLPLDPYLVGMLLGDGYIGRDRTPTFSSADQELVDALNGALPVGMSAKSRGAYDYILSKDAGGSRPNPLLDGLRSLDMIHTAADKFVPRVYMHASIEQRIALLRGLMDTDGCAGRDGTNEFCSVSKRLADDVAELVESLGGIARRGIKVLPAGNLAYRVNVKTTFCPFGLTRKVDRWKAPTKYPPGRIIVAIDEVEPGEATCISVGSPDHLFVIEHHIVTHNTRQAIAAAAILRSKRTVICVPPVTITGWVREITESGLHEFALGRMDAGAGEQGLAPPTDDASTSPSARTIVVQDDQVDPDTSTGLTTAKKAPKKVPAKKGRKSAYPDGIAVFVAGRKEPELPDAGVVIVPDSLLVSRPELLKRLCEWRAEVVIVDEAHRAMNYWSGRSKALRKIAGSARKQSIAMSGTPFVASVVELAGPLAISGHLDTVFGGFENFRMAFAKENFFKAWVTRKSELDTLYRALNKQVWVRRSKIDVLKDLPPKRRVARYVDVDVSLFKEAHKQCVEIIDEWIDDFELDNGRLPDPGELAGWARGEISLITRLRRAAGLAKVPFAVELIADWVETHSGDGDEFDRPLIVWAHHKEVVAELAKAVPERFPAARCIVGGTTHRQRSEIIDAYQAGQIPVLIASIGAAGVGITLTRGCDAIFVETDYTPALVAQAEDRQARRGQTRPVTCTTLIAPGTLDERIQGILNAKFEIIGKVMPGMDADVAVTEDQADDSTTPHKLIVELGLERLAKRSSKSSSRAA